MFTVYLVSFASAVGTAFLVYTREYLPSATGAEEPLSDGENKYEGAEMTSTKDDAVAIV